MNPILIKQTWDYFSSCIIQSNHSNPNPSPKEINTLNSLPFFFKDRLIQAYFDYLAKSNWIIINNNTNLSLSSQSDLCQTINDFHHKALHIQHWLSILNANHHQISLFNQLVAAQLYPLFNTKPIAIKIAQLTLIDDHNTNYESPLLLDQANLIRHKLGLPSRSHHHHTSTLANHPSSTFIFQANALNLYKSMIPVLIQVSHQVLDSSVLRMCTDTDLAIGVLLPGLDFLDYLVFPLLVKALGTSFQLDFLYQGLLQHLAHSIVIHRAEQLIDMIHLGHERCQGAITDLQLCVQASEDFAELASLANAQIQSKMLISTLPTSTILTWFISAIQLFRAIDPKGLIFTTLIETMRNYMRSRDVVRDLVQLVFPHNGCDVLHPQLLQGQEIVMDKDEHKYIVHVQETFHQQQRQQQHVSTPESLLPTTCHHSSQKRAIPTDTLSILINIYDSKACFITAFQEYLHSWLLEHWRTCNLTTLNRVLDQLAVRFGLAHFRQCIAMVRDVDASVQFLKNLDSGAASLQVCPLIISREVWPLQVQESIKMPSHITTCVQSNLDSMMNTNPPNLWSITFFRAIGESTQLYQKTNPCQALDFQYDQGSMHIDIELDDRSIHEFECSPKLAIFIMHVSKLRSGSKSSWTLDQVAKSLGNATLQPSISLEVWRRIGVIVHVRDGLFRVTKSAPDGAFGKDPNQRVVNLYDIEKSVLANPGINYGCGNIHQQPPLPEILDVLVDVPKALVNNWTTFTKTVVINRGGGTIDQVFTKVSQILVGQKPGVDQIAHILSQLVHDGLILQTDDGVFKGN